MGAADRTLHSERLELRPAAESEVEELHALWTRPAVRRFLFDDRELPRQEVRALVRDSDERFATRGFGLWTVRERGHTSIAGTCGFLSDELADPDLLYLLGEEHRGRGFAREAAAAALDRVLLEKGEPRAVASVDEPNSASVRVLLSLGMQLDRVVEREGSWPLRHYAIDSAAWRSSRGKTAAD